jgi:hypothetical protein
MSLYPIAAVVGSLRRDSFNRKLASAVVKLAPPEFTFKQAHIGDLPLYNQDDDSNPAAAVKQLKDDVRAARGLLFVTAPDKKSQPAEMSQLGLGVELKAYAAGEECTTLLGTRFLESREADRIALGGHAHLRHEPV